MSAKVAMLSRTSSFERSKRYGRSEAKTSFSELVAIAFLLALALGSLDTNFLVVLLEGSQILASLAEFALLHTFADVVMNERTLGVHQIELVINSGHHFRNR